MEIKTRQINDKPLTIIIEYPILDTKTKRLIKKIKALDFVVSGNSNGKVFQVHISDIYYMEAVERKTFLYTKDEVFMTDKKLQTALRKNMVWNAYRLCTITNER